MEREVLPQQGPEQPAGSPNSVSELALKVLKGAHMLLYSGACAYRAPGPLVQSQRTDMHTQGNFDLGKSRDPQKSQLLLVSQFVARQC